VELDDLTITTPDGRTRVDLVEAAAAAQVRHTIVGASTCTVVIPTVGTELLTSVPSVGAQSTATVAGREHRRVAVHHIADQLRLIFEDVVIAALRQQRHPFMFATALPVGDVVNRFATEAGVLADIDPALAAVYVEGVGRSRLEETDSWREISTVISRLGGRVFSNGSRLIAATDATLLARDPRATITGDSEPLKSGIDFSIDVAQPQERASFKVDTAAWTADAGDVVEITGTGPADGRWLVSQWTRWLPITGSSQVRLTRPLTIGA